MFRFRNSELPPNFTVRQYSSDAAIQEHRIRESPRYRENWIVILWLQHFLVYSSEPSDIIGTKWLYTKNTLTQTQRLGFPNSIITDFDIDAPSRQKKNIENKDKMYDEQVFRYIFELMQAGKYKEACNFCDLTGNISLSLAIAGIYEYFDSFIEGSNLQGGSANGILNKALWRRMCWQLTQDNTLSSYERGIYGILSSDIPSVLSLSHTWETQLLLYLSSLVTSEAEQSLFEKNRIEKDVALIKVPQSDFTSSAEILNLLSNSPNSQIKKESQHSCRRFISAIINNELDFIVDYTAKKIEYLLQGDDNEMEEEGQDLENSIRFAIHVMLFLQQIGQTIGEEQNRDIIIQTYIEILRTSNHSNLIPLYVSYLSNETALTAYSIVLADIEDPNERRMHIALAKKYGLDIENTIRRAVSDIFDLYDDKDIHTSTFEFSSEVSESDKRICKAVEWYMDNGMWSDCIHTSVLLYRMLLNKGKIQTVREFSRLIPIEKILKSYKTHRLRISIEEDFELSVITEGLEVELREYQRLLNCLELIEIWNLNYASTLNTKNQSQPHIPSELWKRDAITLCTKVSDSIQNLCATWLFEITESEKVDNTTKQLIFRLRTRYIPFLLIELLRTFIEAQLADPSFLKEAASLATFVASEDLKLYDLFVQSGRLSLFLETIADACADGVVHGERGIFE